VSILCNKYYNDILLCIRFSPSQRHSLSLSSEFPWMIHWRAHSIDCKSHSCDRARRIWCLCRIRALSCSAGRTNKFYLIKSINLTIRVNESRAKENFIHLGDRRIVLQKRVRVKSFLVQVAQAIIGLDYPCKLRNYESFHLAARIVVADRFLFQIGTISHPGGLAWVTINVLYRLRRYGTPHRSRTR